ncbi:MAG: hypothetical protein RR090_11710 [Niameybacter sp.]|uniref:stalk domain-containing protein n=1 Tax=Niameybacter sp. TaxID=2033640 RepID=UPI002FC68D9C
MSKKLLMLLTAMGTLTVTLIASPIVKNVTAQLDPSISFNLNGEKVMADSNALMYNDTLYLPVRALGTELGADIAYKDKVVYISIEDEKMAQLTEAQKTEMDTKSVEVPAEEVATIESATLKDISTDSKQLTILPAGAQDVPTNMIILNLDETTVITVDGKAATLADLSLGMELTVTHSLMMTRSLPPQTAAFTIEAKTTASEALPEFMILEDVQIVEITETPFGNQVLVGKNQNPESPEFQTILNVSEETSIHHEKNKMLYTVKDLEKGMKITVKHAPVMALSFPGQTAAYEIVILTQQ